MGAFAKVLPFYLPSFHHNLTVMQKTILTILVVALLGSAYTTPDNGNATVRKIQGVQIFIYSDPVQSYDVIDSGKILITVSGSCNSAINSAASKAAKINADGVIFHPDSDRWEAIKFN